MTTPSPFDRIAPQYETLWTNTESGWRQRTEVWRELDVLFSRGDIILDLGCGTGDDAVHLGQTGIRVIGVDASVEMVRIAQSRGVVARHLPIEQISQLKKTWDGALSNFGALNCIPDLRAVAKELGRLVRPEGPVALCLMNRISLRETVSMLMAGKFRKAFRRWTGRAAWRGTEVFYPTSLQVRRAFALHFRFERRVSIGGGDHSLYIFTRRRSC